MKAAKMGFEIVVGDCLTSLRNLPSESVHCCVTSPPYWGLRDYGVDGQLGLEESPELFVAKMVEVFEQVRRVLKNDGTLWLNLGDSYYNYRPGKGQALVKQTVANTDQDLPQSCARRGNKQEGIKEKDLVGIPWAVAFALRAAGWHLRQDIIWAKPNPMPESVKDRCTKSHEYIFLMSKSPKYYFDSEAIKEPSVSYAGEQSVKTNKNIVGNMLSERGVTRTTEGLNLKSSHEKTGPTKNKRDVWFVAPQPFREAHFATYPPKLIEPCILAGCPQGGTVLDPFCGSGTTGVVALQHGRNFIGLELNPEYAEMSRKRIKSALPVDFLADLGSLAPGQVQFPNIFNTLRILAV